VSRLRALLPQLNDLTAMRRQPGRDLLAGCTVGIVALPLALGFGMAATSRSAAPLVR